MTDSMRGNPPDVKFVPVGSGMSMTFKCAGPCKEARRVLGRRKRNVRGSKQWVCATCAEGLAS
jgi:hypothetical protein